ncbi:MAG: glycosyltransferase [Reinekea sp.]|jgi:glycosyltransferase involved in cell wall biosynthesis
MVKSNRLDKEDITLFSTADWDNPFWTNKQHVAKAFADDGYRVLYIESVGLRAPTATASDLSRIVKRLKKALRLPEKVYSSANLAERSGEVFVLSPFVIPLQRYALVRAVNKLLLSASVRIAQLVLGIKRHWLWSYNPLTLELLSSNGYRHVIYHCVDAIEQQPGMPKESMILAERALSTHVDAVFCTSRALLERHLAWGANACYFSNVADIDHFSRAKLPETVIPDDLTAIQAKGPVLGFVGAISRYKQNFTLLKQIAERKPDWQIVLIGKVGEGDPTDSAEELSCHPNIHLLGPRPYNVLPAYLKGFSICMLPVAVNEYTRNMFPMKFYEYLMAGKDVVAIDIESLQAVQDFYFPAKDVEPFIDQCENVLSGATRHGLSLEQHLSEQTYQARNQRMLAEIHKLDMS